MAGKPPGARDAPFATPPHLRDVSGGLAVWFTEPPGAVIRVVPPSYVTLDMVRWLVGPGLVAMAARFPEPVRLILVLDLGGMTGRDVAVRSLLVEAAKALRPRLARAIVLPPETATTLYLASLSAGVALLRAFGVTVEIARSVSAVVRAAGLRPARA